MHLHRVTALVCGLSFAPALAAAAGGQEPASSSAQPTRVVVYPLLVEATLFGASADTTGDGGASGQTDYSLNSVYMTGAVVQFRRWFVEGKAAWASVSASRTTPLTTVHSKYWLADARGGPHLGAGFSLTAGVRRVSSEFDATLTGTDPSRAVPIRATPDFWDPLVGVDWRRDFGSFRVNANAQAGGFGVGTDVDVSTNVHVDWRFVPHVTLRLGFQTIYYKWTADTVVAGQTSPLVSRQSLYGPSVGFGIEF
jgi:hypothetical protein